MLRLGLFFVALFVLLGAAQGAPLEVGAPWPAPALADQYEKAVTLASPPLTVLLFTTERKPGDWAQAVIDQHFQARAKSGQLALVFDVSRMPSLVTSMFAMPSFRGRPFPIIVAREAPPVAFLPRKEGSVTVIRLEAGKVLAIDYANDEPSLEQLLKKVLP